MGDVPLLKNEEDCLDLPPGFRFHPTDEEIITHYLSPKVLNPTFTTTAIGDVDLNKSEPWDLPSKAKMGEKEWYFFCQKDRKYPTGMRTNRATEAGYWKATGKDKEIFRGKRVLVGMKKTLVFYRGRAPKGEKTNWVMHEFRLEGKSQHSHLPRTAKEEWAVCKVFHKSMGIKRSPIPGFAEDLLYSPTLPPLMDPPYFDPDRRPRPSYADEVEDLDFKATPASYFTTMQGMEDLPASINHHPQTSLFYPLNPSPNYLGLPAGPAGLGYSHPDQHALLRAIAGTGGASPAMRRYSRAAQFSSQSMVSASPDTAVSADRNTEISSPVASKHERGYDELDGPSSVGPVMDLEDMWNY